MKPMTWDAQRRVNLSPRFFLEHPAWTCSPLATKLFLFLFTRANHPPTEMQDGIVVQPGQFRRSLRRLARDLHVKDPRFVKRALTELCSAGCITLRRQTPQSVASSAVASDALQDRKSALVTINGFNALSAAVASDASQSTSYGSRRRRAPNGASSLSSDQRAEIQLRDRAQMRSERKGIPVEEALRHVRAETETRARTAAEISA
jgi:DNA-binding transcriptional regulator YhcF (GntR family)